MTNKKLQNKKQLKPKKVEKPLTIEQQIKQLEQEKQRWRDCWNAMLEKSGEFFPPRKIKDPIHDMPKEKDTRQVIVNCFYEMVDKVNEDFNNRKEKILAQMTPTQRWEWKWNELQKEKADWEKTYQKMVKKIEEYYKTHKGGGMYYRWLADDDMNQTSYFEKIERKLEKQNPELYAKKVAELKKQQETQQESEQEK